LDLGATPVAEVGSFLQERPRPIQAHLLVALHVCLARVPQDDQRTKRWLADVLQAADGDPWRKQARDALARSEWPALEKLLKEITVTQQSPALLLLLSSYLPGDAWNTKHDLVLRIQQSYPSEPVVSRFATAQTYDILAWNWADDQDQNRKRAVELAKRAVRLAPKDGDFWNTMGVAYYRAGNWTDAVAALETARELSKGGDAVDWLFLAMAHWRLGHKDEARKWYDQAIRSPQTSTLLEGELPRFRAEAAKLLGIEK
jgi:tetratricopeptide (TPR) repeat protein